MSKMDYEGLEEALEKRMAKIPGFHIDKDGKVVKTHKARDASHAIRMKKSKKIRPVKPGTPR